MEKKAIIDVLYSKRANYADSDQAEMALNLLNKVSSDIYSESKRFVFELIQNADDASLNASNEVLFDFLDNCLIVSHNGKPFTEEDIKSLTHAGSSTKEEDSNKTGYKGIGFKSVFGKSKRVSIFTGGFQFRFDKAFHSTSLPWQIIPIWTELGDLSQSIQNSLSETNYAVSTIIELKETEILEKELIQLLSTGEILLFLRNITKVTIKRKGIIQSEIDKATREKTAQYNLVELLKDKKAVSLWIVKTFENIEISSTTKEGLAEEDDIPAKLKTAKYTELSFAAKLNNDQITSLPKSASLIYTYLPTKVKDYEFPFLINGSFLTNAPREALHEDSIWNKWLFQLAGELILTWYKELSTTKYCFQILNIIPSFGTVPVDKLRKAFDDTFHALFPQCDFIIDKGSGIRNISNCLWDKTGLSDQLFINKNDLAKYISSLKNVHLDENCFVNNSIDKIEKLSPFGIATFEIEDISAFFHSSYFSETHHIDQNYTLIEYFKNKSDADTKGIWFQNLKNLPFIFNDEGILSNPLNGICFPIGITSTELGRIPSINVLVYNEILKNNEILEWLKLLGVKEPSDLTYVTNVIIPGLQDENFIHSENYLTVSAYLLKLYISNQLDPDTLNLLRDFRIKIKGSGAKFIQAQYCYLADRFNPYLKIENHISGINYVSEEYLKIETNEIKWHQFFKSIKIKDRIEIEIVNGNRLPAVRRITSEQWVDQSRAYAVARGGYGFGESNIISNIKLPSFLSIVPNNYLFAQLFWDNVLSNNNSLTELSDLAIYRYGVGHGENFFHERIENFFKWFVKHNKCIPASTDEMIEPSLAYASTKDVKQLAGKHLPVFTYESALSDEWKRFLGLKTTFELEDYLLILNLISTKSLEDGEVKKNEIKRIGLIYNKIAELLPDYTEDKKTIIKEWTTSNKILSLSDIFESPAELRYINIPGFAGNESLKLIQLPSVCDFNSDNFRELLELLSVQIIDEFEPCYLEAEIDFDLKNKLWHILPYFAKLIDKRENIGYSKEYKRLETILDKKKVFTAKQINLSFTHLNNQVFGPNLSNYVTKEEFYYVGKFSRPLIRFPLIPQIAKLFSVAAFTDELRLLFDLEEDDIKEWFTNIGIDITEVINSLEYKNSITKHIIRKDVAFNPLSTGTVAPNLIPESTIIPLASDFVPELNPSQGSFSKVITYSDRKKDVQITVNDPPYSTITNEATMVDVGRWAEEYIYEYLKTRYSTITWLNKDIESYSAYDFLVYDGIKEIYIEVKGTPSNEKNIFQISRREWNLMFQKEQNYFIYRVFSVGKKDVSIEIIENPAKEIKEGNIMPSPINLQI